MLELISSIPKDTNTNTDEDEVIFLSIIGGKQDSLRGLIELSNGEIVRKANFLHFLIMCEYNYRFRLLS